MFTLSWPCNWDSAESNCMLMLCYFFLVNYLFSLKNPGNSWKLWALSQDRGLMLSTCPNSLRNCRKWDLTGAQTISLSHPGQLSYTLPFLSHPLPPLLFSTPRELQAPSCPSGSSILASHWVGARTSQWMDWWTWLSGPRDMHCCSGENLFLSTLGLPLKEQLRCLKTLDGSLVSLQVPACAESWCDHGLHT